MVNITRLWVVIITRLLTNYKLRIQTAQSQNIKIHLRIPTWAQKYRITINQEEWVSERKPLVSLEPTAQGYDPRLAQYVCIDRIWHNEDLLTIELDMPIQVHRVYPKVKSCSGKAAL
ncbi:MAG: hypothetical protein CVU41_19175 [Chloroflexi bacterium HGW-Chloroflexi-3]|nr:MAG: hypothetical protein CVU41_19175 [Chloroflexi bacterium HGW-Chloroflexi-3]